MANIKKYKPTTPSRRSMTGHTFSELTAREPFKPLTINLRKSAGRNNTWRITTRHQGGWHKQLYRLVDFFYADKLDIPAKIETIEYDPYRSAYISLICYVDWERRYIIAHKDVKVGDTVITSASAKPVSGNRMEIGNIPVGLNVHNVEIIVGQWAANVRSAWTSATILSQEGEYTQVKMPSGEIRLVHKKCYATIWVVSNTDHNQIVIGKAGRSRWMGKRPTVLGKSMNPVDHPHWGWEWHSPIGMPYPKTPWGKPALGVKTRRRKDTSRWILRTRKGKLMNK
ncbi:MAG: 50S ribosomal protein L2 [uncultured bacterium (gcode 4)]|uniref:Large ribosomal subunit protein uL2 n=1 Tax=uncultured bacterium (gcode 4) TaxID=1234023 RepID=K2G1W8_9BACT|nr:MAG: 50S ribosomal protein L2 [uncultured bacterium (gcode 4)]